MKTFDHLNVIGLREWIALPDLGLELILAKVDSGAKTSAMHASDITPFQRNDRTWVSFNAHIGSRKQQHLQRCEAELVEIRPVTSSNGVTQERMTIRTTMILGDRSWPVEFTLTCRKAMRYRVLIGCTAMVDGDLVINPGLRFVQDKPNLAAHPVRSEDNP